MFERISCCYFLHMGLIKCILPTPAQKALQLSYWTPRYTHPQASDYFPQTITQESTLQRTDYSLADTW
uniref:Uncharacterized protein n=1 Tax=Anguilla anguilla TaxID=7936 RepID=A0A0E9QNU0_ANGAN